ncbi:MAG: hypothetical protein F4Y04_02560 [Chloroflexi bacterium]|nr:hypothetical protein [Chloroflexota bacterium]
MSITDRFTQLKTVAVAVIGFIRRHPRVSIAAAAALFILGPLLTGSGGGAFIVNLVGLGIVALVVRWIMRANNRHKSAKARQANCRCHCHRQQQTQRQGGTP